MNEELKLPRTYKGMTPIDRIFSKSIRMSNGCIEYSGYLNECGYGRLRCNGKHHLVHKFIFESFKGSIPEGMLVCHSCDNRKCINIEHLFLGTHKDNIHDAINKGRHKGVFNSPFVKGNSFNKLRKKEEDE